MSRIYLRILKPIKMYLFVKRMSSAPINIFSISAWRNNVMNSELDVLIVLFI